MKKFKHLSKESIKLNVFGGGEKHKKVDDFKGNLDWDLSAFKGIEVAVNSNHFRLTFDRRETIAVSKSAECQIRRVEEGILKGCFVLINKDNRQGREDEVYVVGDRGVMPLNLVLGKDEDLISVIDYALEKSNFERIVARNLNTFNIRKRYYQKYEMLCDAMPSQCWKDKTFAKNVLDEFYKFGSIYLDNEDIDPRYVDLKSCKKEAEEYFVNFAKSQMKEKTEEKVK